MKKTDKKIEKKLISALTHVCDSALDQVEGFQWLTHQVNFNSFPDSLSIICVFESADVLEKATMSGSTDTLHELIRCELKSADILLTDIRKHVLFDTEEACEAEHDGKWNIRLRKH